LFAALFLDLFRSVKDHVWTLILVLQLYFGVNSHQICVGFYVLSWFFEDLHFLSSEVFSFLGV